MPKRMLRLIGRSMRLMAPNGRLWETLTLYKQYNNLVVIALHPIVTLFLVRLTEMIIKWNHSCGHTIKFNTYFSAMCIQILALALVSCSMLLVE